MEVAMPALPRVECGFRSARSRSRVVMYSAAAGHVTVASSRERCAPSAADLSRRDDDWRFGKSRLNVGARFPIISELFPKLRARRNCLVTVRAEKDENGTEETLKVVNLEQPLTTEKTADSTNLGQPLTTEETPDIANLGQPIIVKKSALLTSLDFWVQVAIFVFAAGFVDAGFSGDWSRIGVLSKETEEELQIAALGVVPLSITLIWSINKRRKNL